MEDRRVLRRDADGALVEHADLSPLSRYQINDMVVDARGHAFVGQMGYDLHGGGGVRPAALLRVDPDGSTHEAADAMRVANGMAVANDDRTLVVAESAGKVLTAFDVADDGTLSNRRVWAELPDYPDGMCIDAEDGVWFACPVGDRFIRVVEGGEVTDEIPVPGRHAISVRPRWRRRPHAVHADGHDPRQPGGVAGPAMAARIEITRVTVPGAERP